MFVDSFKWSERLVLQAKDILKASGLAFQLLNIKDYNKCLVRFTEAMESFNYTIKEVVRAMQVIDFEGFGLQ